MFAFRQCPACHYAYVQNPIEDYAAIYDERYYRGDGPDPMLDYVNELDHPDTTVRQYEWRGILKVVQALTELRPQSAWLDYGCGNGGLVRHVRAAGACRIDGFEEGWIADRARAHGISLLTRPQLAERAASYDVITAIEVIEHIPDPLSTLRAMRELLKPGGLLFLTTGNAKLYRDKLLDWPYAIPEIHVSFFEPATLATALELAGFRPEVRRAVPGFDDILRFKILKNLGARQTSRLEKLMPWPLLCYAAEKRYEVMVHPIGWAV
jgi:2-polyprenyl-3-methyl-5-hydroxy-6-metoxy-1,4-benzoquinol methylase